MVKTPPKPLETEIRYLEPVLCYVSDNWAYFTTRQLDKQWGDDWDNCPRSCNSEEPYDWFPDRKEERWTITKVAWDGAFHLAPDHFSTEEVNAGAAAWLVSASWSKSKKVIVIKAGVTLSEFQILVQKAGGTVYLPAMPSESREHNEE